MPELPEVETVVKQLDKIIKGKDVTKVEILREKSFSGKEKTLVGKRVKRVWRKSKMIVMEFEDWKKIVLIHLKMTGQLVFDKKKQTGKRVVGGHPTADWVSKLPSKHTRVIIIFNDGSRLFFNDMRVFGWVKILGKNEWKNELEKLPMDIIDKELTVQLFKEKISSSKRAIKLVLMDQNKIGGVGNIYANDGLFLAGINPKKSACKLGKKEVIRLWKAVRKVVNKGILTGGASYSDYKDTRGLGGKYQEYFLVYGREGKKCIKCKRKIEKFKLAGRGTYWCPKCQMR